MKRIILVSLLLFCCISMPSAFAAHYFNEQDNDALHLPATNGFFVLRTVKADRAMTANQLLDLLSQEEEDIWKISFHFLLPVTNVQIVWTAIDGVNDGDSRSYTDKWDALPAGSTITKKHDNFPTYVDNMKLLVTYTAFGVVYVHTFVIYSLDREQNQGSGVFWANHTDGDVEADTLIPEQFQRTDGDGAFGENPMDALLSMIKAPYELLKWATSATTIISFAVAGFIIYVSIFMLIKFNSTGGEVGAGILLLVGIMMFAGTFFDGIGVLGFD